MKTNREKVSYCIGLQTISNLKNQFKDLDFNLLMQGIQDGLEDKTPAIEREEINKIMKSLQQQIQAQQKAYITQVAEENKSTGEKFLEENKRQPGVITLPSGLQYRILSSGTGSSPTVHDEVTCHYRGSFIDGKIFDSSYEQQKPQTFPLNRVIAGWVEALKLMKIGDKWQLFIPSYLAYGETGYGPYIQPNMVLIFEMELLGIND